jgi:1-acyl-sn-glycerol-3-phosphate acyltransferase
VSASPDPQDEAWARTAPARALRGVILRGAFGPLVATRATVEVTGREALDEVPGPVIFVANHSSHVDTPILLNAMTPRRRRRTLVGAASDYFYTRRALAVAVSLTFGTVPVRRRRSSDMSSSLAPLERLLGEGFSLVLFAEGTRSRSGRLGEFRSGAAALATRAQVPLVPVHVSGTAQLMPPGRPWMVAPAEGRTHPVTVRFGAPLRPATNREVPAAMDEVRRFMISTV